MIPSKRTCTGRSCELARGECVGSSVRAGCASLADSPGVREGVAPLEELFALAVALFAADPSLPLTPFDP